MSDLAIEAEGLIKTFGSFVAVDGVSLTVPRGAVYGLLGPNGAGKTTTVRMLTTLLRPDGGRALIDGIDVADDPAAVRTRIGLTGQYAAVEERLTARENLHLVGRLYHLPRREITDRSTDLLSRFDLVHAADRIVKEYSGGMRRRLDIAMSLIARPSVLFLDEPTTGLDPRSRRAMWEVIERLGDDGTTVLLTTQYLDEVDRLAERIVVIDSGAVIANGTVDELKEGAGGDRLVVRVVDPLDAQLAAGVLEPLCTDDVEVRGSVLSATVPARSRAAAAAIRALDAVKIEVDDIEVRRPTLDDVFLQLTGRAGGDESGGGS